MIDDFRVASEEIIADMDRMGISAVEIIAISDALEPGHYHIHDRLISSLFSKVRAGERDFNRMQIDHLRALLGDLQTLQERAGFPLCFSDASFYARKLRSMKRQRAGDRPSHEDWELFGRISRGELMQKIADSLGISVGILSAKLITLAEKFDNELVELQRIRHEAEHELAERTLSNQGLGMGESHRF